MSIEIDSDVFGFLQRHARPFVDKPNDVLRRLLLEAPSSSPDVDRGMQKAIRDVDKPNDVLRRLLLEAPSSPPDIDRSMHKAIRDLQVELAWKRSRVPSLDPDQFAAMLGIAGSGSSEAFVRRVMTQEFGPEFAARSPYRMMFETDDSLVYFQNFNKPSPRLWYRVTERPWKLLCTSEKRAWVCLTNPAESYAYLIPVHAIRERATEFGWTRDYLEINVDVAMSRWIELDWRINLYLRRYEDQDSKAD